MRNTYCTYLDLDFLLECFGLFDLLLDKLLGERERDLDLDFFLGDLDLLFLGDRERDLDLLDRELLNAGDLDRDDLLLGLEGDADFERLLLDGDVDFLHS